MTTYFAISGSPVQYTVLGAAASGYVLKAYRAGTSTPIVMATDYTGGTTVSTITLNAFGYPSVSGNVIIPHIAENYKLALYPSQAAADSNTGAIFNPDNNQVSSTQTSGALTDVASASTVNLNSSVTDYFNITGTTTINAITLAEGVEVTVKFAGVVTVTHGTFLINIGAVNITTQAGDIARFRGEAGGVVRMTDYTRTVITGSVTGYQVTDTGDISLSNYNTGANVGSTVSISIPTKGLIGLIITARVDEATTANGYVIFGIKIGATTYWPIGVTGVEFGSLRTRSTGGETYFTAGGLSTSGVGGSHPVYFGIEESSIPTGTQTVQIVAAKNSANAVTIKGTVATTRVNIAVFNHS